jgi:parvulin-like peptidyl-prolyl isomerase
MIAPATLNHCVAMNRSPSEPRHKFSHLGLINLMHIMHGLFVAALLCTMLATPTFADSQKIAAVVNEDPITMREFQARKRMIIHFNNLHGLTPAQDKTLNNTTIEGLIEEQILFQQGKKFNITISEGELTKAISDIETRNKMGQGQMAANLRAQGIGADSFRSKIRSELLKSRLVSDVLVRNISVSPSEVDAAVLDTNSKDASMTLKVLTANDSSEKSYNKMISLAKKLPECKKINPSAYKGLADVVDLDTRLSGLEPQLQTVVKDMVAGDHSDVIKVGDSLKIVAVCSKKIENFSDDETAYVINFLGNKKLSLKAQKYTGDLRKKAYVKIFPLNI